MVLTCIGVGGWLYWHIALYPGSEIKRENIRRILGKESPVYYNDGKTRLGVFFDTNHRQYVLFHDIPVHFINAMVASEDNRFFGHFGFDILGIVRAAIKNIQARRVVQGGSTLTQQTAKNLFERVDRSFQAKLKELLFALRLEYHYEKEEIFEFYANQFYVSGNAHGLGVAARYYFDKSPSELSLLECAFIAGSVKKPNSYNPFIKKSKKSAEAARKRGKIRVAYVLKKMNELQMIDRDQYQQALSHDVVFEKGKVGFALDHVMEMVRDAVSTNEVLEGLAMHNISNVATSGVRVITTVDKGLQTKTLYALRHDLSRLDVRLRGYERENVQKELATLEYKGDRNLKKHSFLFGEIEKISRQGKESQITVDFGHKLGTALIDYAGIGRLVTARVRWEKYPWSEADNKDYEAFLEQLQEGDTVWVSVRETHSEKGVLLDLEKYPKLNGGALVVKDGVIKAMAGGVENRFFNRAVSAQRTMGSSFKPFVFTGALQLGWNAADDLLNKRDLFVFQGQPYFPRPDHISAHKNVSMSWTGVHSENVASVWLLFHLCDKLSSEEFREVAEKLELAPRVIDGQEEPYSRFRARIRDKYGIVVNRSTLLKAAYEIALKNVESDFVFEGRANELKYLDDLHYGLGFDRFKEEIDLKLESEDEVKELKKHEKKELLLRKDILSKNYLLLSELREEVVQYADELDDLLWNSFSVSSFDTPDGKNDSVEDKSQEDESGKLYFNTINGEYCFVKGIEIPDTLVPADLSLLQEKLFSYTVEEIKRFWQNIRLNASLSVAAFDIIQKQVDRENKRLSQFAPYHFEVLEKTRDFRVLVGLHYLIDLSRQMGIKSTMEPVLSLPLGANVVTLLEAVRMYEGLATGEVVVPGEKSDENGDLLTILDRIESADGEVIYRPIRKKRRVMSGETAISAGHILENIVKFGTGRYANNHVRLFGAGTSGGEMSREPSYSIPLLGKTGTANRYTNASFFGYVPGFAEEDDSLVSKNGFSVGVYVGYDNNHPMRQGRTKITGSVGALPIWSDIVNNILVEKKYEKRLDPVDLTFYGLIMKREGLGQINAEVSRENGGLIVYPGTKVDVVNRYRPSIMTFGSFSNGGDFLPKRYYQPYWKSFAEVYQ